MWARDHPLQHLSEENSKAIQFPGDYWMAGREIYYGLGRLARQPGATSCVVIDAASRSNSLQPEPRMNANNFHASNERVSDIITLSLCPVHSYNLNSGLSLHNILFCVSTHALTGPLPSSKILSWPESQRNKL